MEQSRMESGEKIRIMELKCGLGVSKEEFQRKRLSPNRAFDLGKLPTKGLRQEFRSYIFHRGETLALSSIRGEFWPYNILCQFLAERYANLESLLDEKSETLEHALKVWLVENGYTLSYKHYEKAFGREMRCRTGPLSYLANLYQFLQPDTEQDETNRDLWHLEALPFPLKQNPAHPWHTLNFQGISQDQMRQEVKRACAVTLRYAAVATVGAQIHAAKRFSSFLLRSAPNLTSFCKIGRKELESYLIYLNTDRPGKKSFRTELYHLKSLLYTIGQVYECQTLCTLFLWDDIPKDRQRKSFRIYSDAELQRLNEGILSLNEQIARALVLHQMLGNRISETLTLKQDCLVKRGGHMQIRIFQPKTQRTYYKPASQEVIQLLGKSIAYTNEKFGKRTYIFVQDSDPDQPMHYEKVQYQLMAMIREKGLCDDQGNLMGVATHRFRHNLGKALTELHVEDATIAKLLGHSNTGSVKFYRKFGNPALAQETRQGRDSMDDFLDEVMGEWE